ncbi:MAG: FAD-binding oxidoreductase [Pseudomonadota bacterium]
MFAVKNEYEVSSWGNIPPAQPAHVEFPFWQQDIDYELFKNSKVLAYGMGRSYGDVCLNNDETILVMQSLNRFIHFDEQKGILTVEAGVSLAEILHYFVPRGWMLPVLPGTKFVSIGGAIANDIHGKNHHMVGSFGCHVLKFGLLRSDQAQVIECSRQSNSNYFHATVGGIGLTGIILWASIQLVKIETPFLIQDTIPFYNLGEFFALSQTASASHQYHVAWIDCQSNKSLGRGLFSQANWATSAQAANQSIPRYRKKTIPCFLPNFVLNKFSMKLFNTAYFYNGKRKNKTQISYYDAFFFPLDSIYHWNRIYGKRGFYQYQCLVPMQDGETVIHKLLSYIVKSGQGSFLSVLKTFGHIKSPGMLSFPSEGITLALDFPNQGKKTLKLLESLDNVVKQAGGKVYLAKDARLSNTTFKHYYPQWQVFRALIDPKCDSTLWQRVTKA